MKDYTIGISISDKNGIIKTVNIDPIWTSDTPLTEAVKDEKLRRELILVLSTELKLATDLNGHNIINKLLDFEI